MTRTTSKETEGAGWRPMTDTEWLDGREVILFAHDMVVSARYCKGKWSHTLEFSEHDGPVWSCFDDQFQFEIEEISHDPAEWLHGPVVGWRPSAGETPFPWESWCTEWHRGFETVLTMAGLSPALGLEEGLAAMQAILTTTSPPAPAEAIREEVLEDAIPILEAVLEDRELWIGEEDEILRDLLSRIKAALRQPTPRGDDGEECSHCVGTGKQEDHGPNWKQNGGFVDCSNCAGTGRSTPSKDRNP